MLKVLNLLSHSLSLSLYIYICIHINTLILVYVFIHIYIYIHMHMQVASAPICQSHGWRGRRSLQAKSWRRVHGGFFVFRMASVGVLHVLRGLKRIWEGFDCFGILGCKFVLGSGLLVIKACRVLCGCHADLSFGTCLAKSVWHAGSRFNEISELPNVGIIYRL